MKKLVLAIGFVMTVSAVFSQQKVKKGLGFGALPAISYDSDLGFQYGALVNLFDYGDGTNFPKYNHSLYLELSTYTKGTTIARVRYDSEHLIPNIRTTLDVAYVPDQMADFYGFNGYQSIYDDNLNESYRNFYKNEKNTFRIKADFQGYFGESKFGWVAGYAFYNFKMDSVDIDKLELSAVPGGDLFQKYKSWGLISDA